MTADPVKRAILYFETDHDEKILLEEQARQRGWPCSRYVRFLVNRGLEAEQGEDAPAIGEDRQTP